MAVSQNQSDVAIAALTSYLQAASPDDELSRLKQRLQQVEKRFSLCRGGSEGDHGLSLLEITLQEQNTLAAMILFDEQAYHTPRNIKVMSLYSSPKSFVNLTKSKIIAAQVFWLAETSLHLTTQKDCYRRLYFLLGNDILYSGGLI